MTRINFGKIFISHSSTDKPFVRRLAARLEKAGYSVWLDEKELKAGDALSARISDALNAAPVVIVVVSLTSAKSKWLRYELSIATKRMVNGECRVIPVVIDEVVLPSEVTGLLYADFRKRFASGFRAITAALEHERRSHLAAAPLYVRVAEAVERVFEGISEVSSHGGYKNDDWQEISIPVPSANNPYASDVLYDCVSSYIEPARPLTASWLSDLNEFADKINYPLSLIVTDRPIAIDVIRPDPSAPQLSYVERFEGGSVTTFVELRGLSDDQWEAVLKAARGLLTQLATRLSAAN